MFKSLLFAVSMAFLCTGTLLFAEDLGKPDEVKLDFASLEKNGKAQRYRFEVDRNGQRMQLWEVVFKTTLKDKKIVTEDTYEINKNGEKLSVHMTTEYEQGPLLRPLTFSRENKGIENDEMPNRTVLFKDKQATILQNGKEKRKMDIPEGTVVFESLFRLVTMLPRKEGFRMDFDNSLEISEMNLKNSKLTVAYVGKKNIEINGVKSNLHHFAVEKNAEENGNVYYLMDAWVSDSGKLCQATIDGRKYLIVMPLDPVE